MFSTSAPRLTLGRIVVAVALLAPSCAAHKKSDDDAPAQTTKQPQTPNQNPASPSDKKNDPSSTGPDDTQNNSSTSDSLAVLNLLKSSTINGVQKSYLLLAVGHAPSPVAEITGLQLINGQGKVKDVLSSCMRSKTYYGLISKSALENSGYFNKNDARDAEAIKEILDTYDGAKLLIVSPVPSDLLADNASDSQLKVIAKTADGSLLEN